MSIKEMMDKEYYMVDCHDFVYFPRIVHIVGVGASSCDEELQYYVNMSDYKNSERLVYKNELERFKSFNEAKEYAEHLNNIPENKKRAEQWNKIDKFMIEMFRGGNND